MATPDVLLDVTRSVARSLRGRVPTGIDRVELAYVRHFASRARAVIRLRDRAFVLSVARSRSLLDELAQWQKSGAKPSVPSLLARIAAVTGGLPERCVYLNVGHSGLEQPRALTRLREASVPLVFMVHDLIPITHHEYSRPGEAERHALRMRAVLDLAAGVVSNSVDTMSALVRFADQEGKAMPPIRVAPLGLGCEPHTPGPRPLAKKYFVVIGTIEPRKNLAFLLTVWRRLVERHGDNAPHLVVIGQRGWECESVVDLLERCAPLQGKVHELGRCSDQEMATWLHHAQALVYPSLVEGFGLPLVEALRAGVPAVASDLAVFREQAGEVPEYLDPLDGPGWLRTVEAYCADDCPARVAQQERLRRFEAPAWPAHFERVESFLHELRG